MAQPQFYLKASTGGTRLIMLHLKCKDGTVYKKSTGIRIKVDDWAKDKRRVKPHVRNATAYNGALQRLGDLVAAAEAAVRSRGARSTRELIAAEMLKHERAAQDSALIPYLRTLVGTKNEAGEFVPGRLYKKMEPNSVKVYATLLSHLEQFEKQQRRPLVFEDFGKKTFREFVEFLQDHTRLERNEAYRKKHRGRAVGNNATIKLCAVLKLVLARAVEDGLTTFEGYEDAKVELKRTEPVTTYLNESEISRVFALRDQSAVDIGRVLTDLRPDNTNPFPGGLAALWVCWKFEQLADTLPNETARTIEIRKQIGADDYRFRQLLSRGHSLRREIDRLVLGCWLGLRWSDLSRLRPGNFFERGENRWSVTITQQKTDEPIIIPLHAQGREIMVRLGFSPPKAITSQRVNDYLKEVCLLAGITDPVQHDGQTVPKWQAITTHTMRRSFATNLVLAGVPHYIVMRLTGHKSLSAFERYIRITRQQAADVVAQRYEEAMPMHLTVAHTRPASDTKTA